MRSLDTYLNFKGNALEAFEFYRSVFGGDFGGEQAGFKASDAGRIAHISLQLTPTFSLMGSDVPSHGEADFTMGSNTYININVESPEEGKRLFDALAEGGRIEHPLEKTSWAEQYGSLRDRFGVQWMFNYWIEE